MRNISIAAMVACALVAALHTGFLVLEMFFWDHPIGRSIFNMTPEVSASSKLLAMQQGLYNGFLAAGLVWGLLAQKRDVLTFFLACVITAGVFAAITVKPSVLISQALPAAIALALVYLGARKTAS